MVSAFLSTLLGVSARCHTRVALLRSKGNEESPRVHTVVAFPGEVHELPPSCSDVRTCVLHFYMAERLYSINVTAPWHREGGRCCGVQHYRAAAAL